MRTRCILALVVVGSLLLSLAPALDRRRDEAKGWRPGSYLPRPSDELLLPDLSGLPGAARTVSAGAPASAGPLRIAEVEIDAWGMIALPGDALPCRGTWKGVSLPHRLLPGPSMDCIELNISKRSGTARCDAYYGIRSWQTRDVGELAGQMGRLSQIGDLPVIINAHPDLPFGRVAAAVAAASRWRLPVEFALTHRGWRNGSLLEEDSYLELRGALLRRGLNFRGTDGHARLAVLLRADARAPWSSVQKALIACADSRIWMVSFAAVENRRETQLGNTTFAARASGNKWLVDERIRDIESRPAAVPVSPGTTRLAIAELIRSGKYLLEMPLPRR